MAIRHLATIDVSARCLIVCLVGLFVCRFGRTGAGEDSWSGSVCFRAGNKMASLLSGLAGIKNFNVHEDRTTIAQRWTKWVKQFELYVIASGVTDADQKRALFLHMAGPDIQDIYDTLSASGDTYELAQSKINTYFEPTKDTPWERLQFRRTLPIPQETVHEYVIRLQQKAKYCEFGDDAKNQIRDQVVDKWGDTRVKQKWCSETGLTLDKLLEIARSFDVKSNVVNIDKPSPIESVGRVRNPRTYSGGNADNSNSIGRRGSGRGAGRAPGGNSSVGKTCYRCGKSGHFQRNCPNKNVTCFKCKNVGHYANECKTKNVKMSQPHHKFKKQSVRNTVESESDNSGDETFHIFQTSDSNHDSESECLNFEINGQNISFIPDTGSQVTILPETAYDKLKEHWPTLQKCTRPVYSYMSSKPLNIRGQFYVEIPVPVSGNTITTHIVIVAGSGQALLSRKDSVRLGVIVIGPRVRVTQDFKDMLRTKFPRLFEDKPGKLKNRQWTLHIDHSVPGIIQKRRHIPFHRKEKVKAELEKLIEWDIVEKVDQPSKWISPIRVVEKPNSKVRRANSAVKRVRYPIPTVEETMQDLNGGVVFSKIDLRMGYHQVELDEASREITTFVTDEGLFRFKRLMFGISSASEMFQHIIGQVLESCEGAYNISDDIVVGGRDQNEHDERLMAVLATLEDNGLTINAEKSVFRMSKLRYMGHELSEKGLSVDNSKVRAVLNCAPPKSASELRSFLGLAQYCAKFLPNFSTVSDPLWKLTRADTEFIWNIEQQKAFDSIKAMMTSAPVLVYHSLGAKTRLTTDASPVGLGAVVEQEQTDGSFKPVWYASRSLSATERRYSQFEREVLGIIWVVEYFRLYLLGTHFEIRTDHKPLVSAYGPKGNPPARVKRFALRF